MNPAEPPTGENLTSRDLMDKQRRVLIYSYSYKKQGEKPTEVGMITPTEVENRRQNPDHNALEDYISAMLKVHWMSQSNHPTEIIYSQGEGL